MANIGQLVDKARAAAVDVVWVAHHSDELIRDSDDWQYVPELVGATPKRWCTRRTATPSRTPTLNQCSPLAGWETSSSPARRPTSAFARRCTEPSLAATTRRWSRTRTRPRTSPRTARHRRSRSSPTPTCTGATTRPRPAGGDGRHRRCGLHRTPHRLRRGATGPRRRGSARSARVRPVGRASRPVRPGRPPQSARFAQSAPFDPVGSARPQDDLAAGVAGPAG